MEPTGIIEHIRNIRVIGATPYSELSQLSEKYPWFGAVHILQSKCLHNQNKYGFKQALKKAALYTGDREVLYSIIHDAAMVKDELIPVIEKHTTPIASDAHKSDSIPVTDTLPVTPPDAISQNPVPIATADDQVEPIIEETQKLPITPEPVLDPVVDLPVYDPTVELLKLVKEDPPITTAKPKRKVKKKKAVKTFNAKPETHDFVSWLDTFSADESSEKEQVHRKLPMSEESKRLLDNFIKNRPSVSRMKKDFFNPTELAKISEDEDSDLVSETLANLYLKQEMPLKAIQVYEKLQLQIPQKFSYFAALIEKVRKDHDLA